MNSALSAAEIAAENGDYIVAMESIIAVMKSGDAQGGERKQRLLAAMDKVVDNLFEAAYPVVGDGESDY